MSNATGIREVIALFNGAKFAEAGKLCDELCRGSLVDDAQAWFTLSTIHLRLGKYAEAERAGSTALALSPGNAAIYVNLGIALSFQDRNEDAIQLFEKALALDPGATPAYFQLNRIYNHTDRLTASVDILERRTERHAGQP
ncbi:MAG TPA: tetratricopeptide repeat protein [Gammaproteobacteria bacterium]|nr:tetratricopeptide repeat protein [Gammaproteobacteria bacterium]